MGARKPVLQVSGLSLRYGHHRALDDISLSVGSGEIVAVIGAAGAGKSSLLEAICGLVPANNRSHICVGGHRVTNLPPHRIVEAGIALVPQGGGCFGGLTIEENLLLGTYPARVRERKARPRELIYELFPVLAEQRWRTVDMLCEGEQQMVAIGRALMSDPDCLMLDQPSLGLTPAAVTAIFAALDRLRETGPAILIAERDFGASLSIADRGYLMQAGRVIGTGRADALLRDETMRQVLSNMESERE